MAVWKKQTVWIIAIFLCSFLGMIPEAKTQAAAEPGAVWHVRHLLKEKEEAVNHNKWERLFRVLNPDLPAYIEEQKRWFRDAVRFVDPGTFRLEAVSVMPDSEHQLRVWVKQQYRHHRQLHESQYPLLFEETASGWKDSDLPFFHLTRGNVTVHYTDQHLTELSSIAMDAVTKSLEAFHKRYGWQPRRHVEVKLYHHPEWFRQSVKLSLPQWATGWHEANQSIKFVGVDSYADKKWFSSGIVHELTHQMVSELTGDNAAYWLQEGAAEYYQSHLLPGIRTEPEEPEQPSWSLTRLEKTSLESLKGKAVSRYYRQCYLWFRFLVERYGEKKMQQVFEVLQLSPSIDADASDKREVTNQRTRAALRRGLGMPVFELERAAGTK
ncbi:hypothetical protein GCM10011571_28430 [Marinithermofilum abyssi]|uniref:Peptidase MA-like domain-containing protein n=1 Tax=Marinithermofilum abyssi TaxID=1571185 RepID=A0A8J2VJA8_9BACL|nr:hypothetical protein [Marinithermofilum abyssi]GGE24583.1 hypothetical protein GCM10011571_28430 [Marinithermofilum abyssi]